MLKAYFPGGGAVWGGDADLGASLEEVTGASLEGAAFLTAPSCPLLDAVR